ncbi:NACHT domain-containing protein [Christiangramia sp. SM2212]|uniref:NACHT domain-containing protein n=1 Tax=Christiangramia sediminicola TaxID=3073267 RepID=A0ABU1ET48_9FLAO|nr:NACHT domain-containing protein [Christiangramia sp. SM2212]MDR5591167.1 NACHT domain-containing protein [Christiangramia sp. SM2212]
MTGSAPQAGFYYQNNIAALKIIESLFFDTDIQYIQLENYDRGNHIDDVIINRKCKTEFIQVKWSEDESNNYTLYNLISNADGKKSIFRQLADGYKSVIDSEKQFQIILYSTKGISNAARPSKDITIGLNDFIKKVVLPIQTSGKQYDAIKTATEFLPVVEVIRKETGLRKKEFTDFLSRLDFQLKQDSIHIIKDAIGSKFSLLGIEKNLVDKLLTSVVEWSISAEKITKEKVLKQLGLSDRFEDKLSHYFRVVDDDYYVANDRLLKAIQKSVDALDGGYILVEGLPGIGKSTALTKFQELNDDIAFTYYCFIPDSKNNFGELRHKTNYFLKSMCVGIENRFPDVNLPSRYSNDYESKFVEYIGKLSTLGRKIIFIVDGLDHVHRDLAFSENSLLNNIKGNLPENIFIIVSTQYKSVLATDVLQQINLDSKRHIIAKGFTQRNIKEYLTNKGIDHSEILELVEKVSSGIPVYLHYISELLLKTDRHKYAKLLSNLPELKDGEIDTYHEYLYGSIEFSEYNRWVLSFLAFRREHTSIELINFILLKLGVDSDIIKVKQVINAYSHLLKQNDSGNFSVFHNSFREFILRKTEDITVKFGPALIDYYEQNPNTDEAFRNYFSHLFDAGNYKKILEVVNVAWIKNAWANLRPIEEIRNNIEIAHNAAIEELNLSEFIRISFLKARILNIEWNFESSHIDFPTLFLKAGHVKNSLRAIWDGDFLLGSKEYFYHYLSEYHLKFSKLLPKTILSRGLGKETSESSYDALVQSLKADTLIEEDPVAVFNRIDKITWKTTDNHTRNFKKTDYSKKQNKKINRKIKRKVVNYLLSHKQFDKLVLLDNAKLKDDKVVVTIKLALAKFFVKDDKNTTIGILNEIDFKQISNVNLLSQIAYFSSFLTFEEIVKIFPKPKIVLPKIENKIIEQRRMNYKIKKNIVSLFDLLKVIWVFEPSLINIVELKVTLLRDPSLGIFESILNFSQFWKDNKTTEVTESSKLKALKKSLEYLYIEHPKFLQKRSYGLMDGDDDSHFIRRSLNDITNSVFQLASDSLKIQSLKKFISYWLELEDGNNGYREHKIGIGFARILNEKHKDSLGAEILKIIQHSEEIVRQDEDTNSLLEHLGEIAEIYGICDFQDHFMRLYNEFIIVAFGVGYRKDYQASYITNALEAVHETDPENTLKRLKDAFSVQTQLAHAGNGRMNHICKSDLISFTGERYPRLAFKLLNYEENNLGRSEAISSVLKPLIEKAKSAELRLLFTVIKTLPKWDVGGTSKGEFLELTTQLLKHTLEIDEKDFIPNILNEIKFNILVELEEPKKFEEFYKLLKTYNLDPNDYGLPDIDFKEDESQKKKQYRGKFLAPFSKPTKEQFLDLFNNDFEKFNDTLESLQRILIENGRRTGIRNEYYPLKESFQDFFDTLSKREQKKIKPYQILRWFLKFKNEVALLPNTHVEKDGIELLFKALCNKIDEAYPKANFKTYVIKDCDLNKIVDEIYTNVNNSPVSVLYAVLTDEDVFEIVTKVSLLKQQFIEEFLDRWVKDHTYSKAILILANRLVNPQPEKAKKMLDDIAEKEYDSLLFSNHYNKDTLGFNVVETLIKADPKFGKRYLLKSFISQKGRYFYELLSSINMLMEYTPYFEGENASESFFKANLEYNVGLAEGLPQKTADYDFVEQYTADVEFSEIIINYIVSLFDYPVIKIRELALKSLLDIFIEIPDYLTHFLKNNLQNLGFNKVEHLLTELISIALKEPKLLVDYKKEIWVLFRLKHFNINQLLITLFTVLSNHNKKLLTNDEQLFIKNLNQPSTIIIPPKFKVYENGGRFIYSDFQAEMLYKIRRNDLCNEVVQDELYTDLKQQKGLGNYDAENEGIEHRNYNINTNFDVIEIHSKYYEEVKNSLNEILYKKIKRDCFEPEFLEELALDMRLYDPSIILYEPITRSSYINWLPKASPEDFMLFKDLDNVAETFMSREQNYVTLFESGSQRSLDGYRESKFTTYFEVSAFLKKRDLTIDIESLKYEHFIPRKNSFHFEMPGSTRSIHSFPVKGILPILEVSMNNFRGEKSISTAMVANEFLEMLEHNKITLFDLLNNSSEQEELIAVKWQNAYTSGRRRYKPSSEGFTLKIHRDKLKGFLDKNNFELCLSIEVSRANTPYVNESHMDWKHYRKVSRVKI